MKNHWATAGVGSGEAAGTGEAAGITFSSASGSFSGMIIISCGVIASGATSFATLRAACARANLLWASRTELTVGPRHGLDGAESKPWASSNCCGVAASGLR